MRCKILILFGFFCFLSSGVKAETIYYSIRQWGFDGQASLTMVGPKEYKGRQTVQIIFKAIGNNYWDQEDIYLDPQSYKPLFVERDFSLNAFGRGKTLEEYQPGQIVITKIDGKKTTKQVIRKEGAVDNIYGFIYRYRKAGSFNIGDVIGMSLPTKDLKIKLARREALKIGKKQYDAYYMQSQPSRYKIWFDASGHKWPLRITGSIGLYNSVMTMTGYDESK